MATSNLKLLCSTFGKLSVGKIITRSNAFYKPPRFRPPYWYMPKDRVLTDDQLTVENKQFLEEVMNDRYKIQQERASPLADANTQLTTATEWSPRTRRVGLIARKIGNYPVWDKNGKKILSTLLQVVDNHVIKYIPPEEFKPQILNKVNWREKQRMGCVLVGSETVDPSTLRKEYCGIFDSVGMLPKQHLCRFIVSPEAALPTGTPLFATHFRVGDHIDVRAKTMDRGFQGVMKRWGFKGMPASHGVTKTHRRPGNIGAGGEKARVWPGTKMPGHMGNRWRILRGVKILRINTKHNVIWTMGVAIPGETGALCYLYDTMLPSKRLKTAPPFPTQSSLEDLPVEYYDEDIHPFEGETVSFEDV
ncbi:large ribosomal subunit protein uL3m [Plodia interpunctella]|uniref:large ribosomal subunit protein uL3m n=1 Tax=Plodia interpunctella TaxID=58824 RepID=UPI00236783BA|nr:39S ribosomal protein L3, mitochondrial [Plodia interpunctella]